MGWADRVPWVSAAEWSAALIGRFTVEVRTDPAAARADSVGEEVGHGCMNVQSSALGWQNFPIHPQQIKRPASLRALRILEAQAGIEPTYTDLQCFKAV